MPWAANPPDDDPRDARIAFGRGIRALRLYHRWTQQQLAERSALNQSTISRLETGRPVPLRFSSVLRVLEAMGVDRTVFKSRWASDTWLAFLTQNDPDGLGPEPPAYRRDRIEPRRDPWNEPWINDADDELEELDLAPAR